MTDSGHVITSKRHLSNNIKTALQNDIETSPGSGEKLKIITIVTNALPYYATDLITVPIVLSYRY